MATTQTEAVYAPPTLAGTLRDLVTISKPRITTMVVITAAGGMWLAPGGVNPFKAILMLATTAAVVSSANALNCWLERDSDRLMARTAKRPLPDGRMDPRIALAFGLFMAFISVPLLTFAVNPLTGLLGAIALLSYVLVYTPMKQRSSFSLMVGAVPGALPPLMGWAAATGQLDPPGIVLFGIMFLWQIPHFIAIASFRKEDYDRAGLKVLPTEKGEMMARMQALLYTGALLPVSLLLYPLGVAGPVYLATAAVLGLVFLWKVFKWLGKDLDDDKAARKIFGFSLLYLTLLFPIMMTGA